jgi:uncharacterized protein involved in type VI secretion and phage assembly
MTDGYFGKYRGVVVDNVDPLQAGRLLVEVADVSMTLNLPLTWALPCVPFAGTQSGFYAMPAKNSQVWIEFEQGNTDYPIWVGCFWGSAAEVPDLALAGNPELQQIVIQTTNRNTLLISDVPGPTGGIVLQSSSGAVISVSDAGITISNGQGAEITFTGPAVTVNDGALEVI